jgi:antitoxin component YwqK of YwqJK toxin-antitoxin module
MQNPFSMRLLLLILLFTNSAFALFASGVGSINQVDSKGKRTGYWVVDEHNNPIEKTAARKWKEGAYVNGRKEGVWINYHADGKTPRLIGEYSDNRPAGAYFRFNEKGEMQQASSVPRKITASQTVTASNKVFTCKINFDNKEVVAGQVYFSKKVVQKNAVQFWLERSLEAISSESEVIDFTWLNTNYDKLYAKYLEVRVPKMSSKEIVQNVRPEKVSDVQVSKQQDRARKKNYFYPPTIRTPRVARGLIFQPNGFNKLYTPRDEIWIDGYFKDGQLQDGKVFIYDNDGVLLKVRVYKNGVYDSDGVL